MINKPSTPESTLLIMLGASEWPYAPHAFPGSPAFAAAQRQLKDYFTQTVALPADNILDLFDSDDNAIDVTDQIETFLEAHKRSASDLITYYIGHAKPTARHNQLYLALKQTKKRNPEQTSLKIADLALDIWNQANQLRRFYLFDCCFSAKAIPDLQGTSEADLFHETLEEIEFLNKGYAALCSSSAHEPSLLLPDRSNTTFTQAFLNVVSSVGKTLSLRELEPLMNWEIREIRKRFRFTHQWEKVPPNVQIYHGSISNVPLFPARTQAYAAEEDGYRILIENQKPVSEQIALKGKDLENPTILSMPERTWKPGSEHFMPGVRDVGKPTIQAKETKKPVSAPPVPSPRDEHAPIPIYISYAAKEKRFKVELEQQLSMMKRQNLIRIWDISQLLPGEPQSHRQRYLEEAKLVLVLLSASYLASDQLYAEAESALQRQQAGLTRVIPIKTSSVALEGSIFEPLQKLPRTDQAIGRAQNRDALLKEVAQEIRVVCAEIIKQGMHS